MPPRAWCTGTDAPWTGAPPQVEPPPTAEGCAPQSSDRYVHQTPSPAKSADPNCRRYTSSVQCSPASPPKGPGSQVATLSCDSAASAPCGMTGARLPLPATSMLRVNRATLAVLLLVAVAAAVVAFRVAEAEAEGQWNLWEPTHCHLPLHSSAEAQNSLLYPHLAAPAHGPLFTYFRTLILR